MLQGIDYFLSVPFWRKYLFVVQEILHIRAKTQGSKKRKSAGCPIIGG